ncbi:MAG: hypothetical protein R3F54_07325 [Alphaproteobacteria bacterium]
MGEPDERRRSRRRASRPSAVGLLAVLLQVGALAGCQQGDAPATDYPTLDTVPAAPRPNLPLEARRDIVRDLITERDRSLQHSAVVRQRSGLAPVPSSAADDGAAQAEDIIPDAPEEAADSFELTPGEGQGNEAVYRTSPETEDGGLNDFIRQLRRDTLPAAPPPEPSDEVTTEEPAAEDTSFLDLTPGIGDATENAPALPLMLAAFAPVIGRGDSGVRDVRIRLAAGEDEPGFFCGWLGWVVAWSTMCLDEAQSQAQQDGDEGVTADLDEDSGQTLEEPDTETESRASDETRRERAERRLSEEEAAEAIEDAGNSVLAPVTSSLDKLRDYLQRRRIQRQQQAGSPPQTSSSEERDLALRGGRETLPTTARAFDQPPIPNLRPKRRDDLVIVDDGERFEFHRTPRPAFKPTPEEPVILPPLAQLPSSTVRREPPVPPVLPPARPADLVSKREETRTVAAAEPPRMSEPLPASEPRSAVGLDAPADDEQTIASLEPVDNAAASPPAVSAPAAAPSHAALPALGQPDEIEAAIITFEPARPGVPEGVMPRLQAVLDEARSRNEKIYIIGEGSSSHLARRRATDIGAALVQLGATVEILEYDHRAGPDVDQVRLVLKPAPPDDPLTEAAPRAN